MSTFNGARRLAYYQHLGLPFPVIESLIYTNHPRCHIGWIAQRVELWCLKQPKLRVCQGRFRILKLPITIDGEECQLQLAWHPNRFELVVNAPHQYDAGFHIWGQSNVEQKILYCVHNEPWGYPTIQEFCAALKQYLDSIGPRFEL